VEIDAALVARLLASQFPQWSDLPITAAEPNGWDNRTFRLGPVWEAGLAATWQGTPVWVHGDHVI
jgi:aminoglycoside phosphotransferase (APT) family kinase protein